MDISLVLSSCDSYSDLWQAFFIQLKKHWPYFNMPVYIVSESKSFHYPDLDIKCPLVDVKKKSLEWSYLLIETLKRVKTEYILFFLDDFWLYKDVNTDLFEKCCNYLEKHKDVGYICLRTQKCDDQYKKNVDGFPEVYEALKGKPYRVTTQTAIWRKEFLLKVLRAHESAWQFERRATWRAAHYYSEKILMIEKEENRVFFYPNAGVCQARCFINQYRQLYDESLYQWSSRGFIDYDNPQRQYSDPHKKNIIADIVSKIKSIKP